MCCSGLISFFIFNVIALGDKLFLPRDEYRSAGHLKKVVREVLTEILETHALIFHSTYDQFPVNCG